MSTPLQNLARDFIGLDTRYPLAGGGEGRRIYLDSAASTLMLGAARRLGDAFLAHYANTHSDLHYGARISTACYHWAHEQVLRFLRADPAEYCCVFGGSGATAMINRAAGALARLRPERDTVLVSVMEHHSNDLPHRAHSGRIEHLPLTGQPPRTGALDLEAVAGRIRAHGERINYIALTGASNVTGILNPVAEVVRLAREHDIWVLVDCAQQLVHWPPDLSGEHAPDLVFFSGHKAYAPGSPGALVGRRAILDRIEHLELGGGMVEEVFLEEYVPAAGLPERLEAGTPNILGAVTLGGALACLSEPGHDALREHEQALTRALVAGLEGIEGVRVYGDTDLDRTPRTGIASFNLEGLDHGLVAAALNDYHGIALRNECFCAHPYVKEMLREELWALDIDPEAPAAEEIIRRKRGMVRASLGIYNTAADVAALLEGVRDLLTRREELIRLYEPTPDGNYRHRSFRPEPGELFDPAAVLRTSRAG
ncbi:MAG: aminotransferase class V-fold PLP-dependent enzyme [Gammaproteobacteria bacterium]|nr:MAG: aminotransferase class V-fold PLP-dependent enzyme [Gammaproteobacteria bacterium]